jgi:flagellar motor protein MotB
VRLAEKSGSRTAALQRGASVNLELPTCQASEQIIVRATQDSNLIPPGTKIERCEFEELLQRAMEILNARDLKAQLKVAETPFSM